MTAARHIRRHIARHAARPPLLAFLALILGLLAGPAAASPVVCTIGVSVESLHDLDMAGDSFGADLWLWTLCPASLPRAPLEKIEFPTAGQLSRDPIEQTDLGDGRTYASQRLSGTFRFNWSMNSYPFDRQRVVIPITDSEYGADSLVFEPDTAEFFLSHDVAGRAARMEDHRLRPRHRRRHGGFCLRLSRRRQGLRRRRRPLHPRADERLPLPQAHVRGARRRLHRLLLLLLRP